MMNPPMINFVRNASYKVLTCPYGRSTAGQSLWDEQNTMQCVFHHFKESLWHGWHCMS